MKQIELFDTNHIRESMDKMQSAMYPVDGNDFVEHYFGPGTYVRQGYLPAGHIYMGKIHREACVNILVQGTICILSEEGKKLISAPYTFVSGPGIRKAAYAVTDVILVNVHQNPTNTKDLEELEQQIIAPDFKALEHL